MSRIQKIDAIFVILMITVWTFYLNFDGQTRFDVTASLTLPLLLALEVTAFATLYGIWRYYTLRHGPIDVAKAVDKMRAMNTDQQQGDETRADTPDKAGKS